MEDLTDITSFGGGGAYLSRPRVPTAGVAYA